jgi:hypothetical protein
MYYRDKKVVGALLRFRAPLRQALTRSKLGHGIGGHFL